MPQMSPILWLFIMIFTSLNYLILLFKLYFINMKWKINNNKIKLINYKKLNLLKMKW